MHLCLCPQDTLAFRLASRLGGILPGGKSRPSARYRYNAMEPATRSAPTLAASHGPVGRPRAAVQSFAGGVVVATLVFPAQAS